MRIATTACLALVCALGAQTAQAQEETGAEASGELSLDVEEEAEAPAEEVAAEPAAEPEEAEEENSDPMNGIGIGLKLGVGMILGQDVASTGPGGTSVQTKQNDVGMALGVPVYFGDGHGFGADLEVFHWRTKENGFNVNYTGGQVALGARFQVGNPIYMFVGLGPRIGVVHGDVDTGFHGALRLPVQVTWYPIDMLGIVGEIGLGYGGTARANVAGGSAEASAGFLLDMTVGCRFP